MRINIIKFKGKYNKWEPTIIINCSLTSADYEHKNNFKLKEMQTHLIKYIIYYIKIIFKQYITHNKLHNIQAGTP